MFGVWDTGARMLGLGKHPKKDAEETKVGLVNKKA